MKNHVILIDPIEQLVVKKDSSLLLAHEFKKRGHAVFILFKNDLCMETTSKKISLTLYDFDSDSTEDFYLTKFEVKNPKTYQLDSDWTIHMRLEPPFDLSYLRSLWVLNFIKNSFGVRIINDPIGIMSHNEKISSFIADNSIETYIGASKEQFLSFSKKLQNAGVTDLILKPLDLFQGLGVEKISLKNNDIDLMTIFCEKVKNHQGQIMAQPFKSEIKNGEIRSIFYAGKCLGTIKKVPKEGSFLANIAQGASFDKAELNEIQLKGCLKICSALGDLVPWIAFDILGNNISEVNVTCPGLLIEVSKAEKKNLALEIVKNF